jgi:CRISPR/Cas system-associated exonuclease Cas4 (RecB family)
VEGTVPVSAVVTASICPRLVYYRTAGKSGESAEYAICKQLAYHLGGVLETDRIWEEVLLVRPGADPAMKEYLAACVAACAPGQWRSAAGTDVPVFSERYGISGRVDRIFDGPPYFSVIRAKVPPVAGISRADRVKITAYMVCLREGLAIPAETGIVEYIREGKIRTYTPGPGDLRRLIASRNAALGALEGKVPRIPPGAPCRTCTCRVACGEEPRRLSDLL